MSERRAARRGLRRYASLGNELGVQTHFASVQLGPEFIVVSCAILGEPY